MVGDERERILRILAKGCAVVASGGGEGRIMLTGPGGSFTVDARALQALVRERLVQAKAGQLGLCREKSPDALAPRPKMLEVEDMDGAAVLRNRAESPLASLMRRRDKDGRPFLSESEFAAGERLRADYTKGQIMPRMGMNWDAPVVSNRGQQTAGKTVEIGDAAMSARMRVDKAIEAVGPELAGVLVDICCFLKGLEQVEAERGWPVRSAKILLKTALGVLDRHYRPQHMETFPRRLLHWGTRDYRPSTKAEET